MLFMVGIFAFDLLIILLLFYDGLKMLLLFMVKESFLSRLVSFFTESKLDFLTLLGGKGTRLTQRLF